MDHLIRPTKALQGTIKAPASKSQSLRALLFASLAKGTSTIENLLDSTDTAAMRQACLLIGADIKGDSSRVTVSGTSGVVLPPEDVIDCWNSGIVLRFFSAIASLCLYPVVITGDESIRNQRPMETLLNALRLLGVSAISTRNNERPPLIIKGPIKSRKTKVIGTDSQPVSALLILGAFLSTPLEIEVEDPGEISWVNLSLSWLDFLKVPYECSDYTFYKVGGGPLIEGFHYYVPGDMSSAAFPVAAALVTGSSLTVQGLDFNDKQRDSLFFDILKQMGAKLTIDDVNKTLTVYQGPKLRGITVDINECIDAICILAATACYAEGETRITNASIARSKECNRIAALVQELSKMGADIKETEDGLLIKGGKLHGARVHSHHDHRMAMALSVAALGASGETIVIDTDCTKKTYPTFFQDFRQIGAQFYEYSS